MSTETTHLEPAYLPIDARLALRRWEAARPWRLLGDHEAAAFYAGWDAAFGYLAPTLEEAEQHLRVVLDLMLDGGDLDGASRVLETLRRAMEARGVDVRGRWAVGERYRRVVGDLRALGESGREDAGAGGEDAHER